MGTGLRNLQWLTFSISFFLLQPCSASHYQQQHLLPSAMVVGTVFCNTCFQQDFSKYSHFISEASVAVSCDLTGKHNLRFEKKVKTNRHGVFIFRLPLELSRNMKAIKSCSVKLGRNSSHYFCSVASSSAISTGLPLLSKRHGVRVFSVGVFAFKSQQEACNYESRPTPSVQHTSLSHNMVRPSLFFPPPIPFLPSPPNVGGIPLPPNPLQPPSIPFLPSPPNIGGVPLPPNPLQPPPSILPPLPFQPPPPSILPPLPFQPPPPPFIGVPPLPTIPPLPNIPPLPFLVPPPSPPPPAFGFPPITFPPFFPGPPPAATAQTIL